MSTSLETKERPETFREGKELGVVIKARGKSRLSRTLSRFIEYRPMTEQDLRFVYAAYKKGALAELGETFSDTSMTPPEFMSAFKEYGEKYFDEAVVFLAPYAGTYGPVGYIALTSSKIVRPIFIEEMVWFPWASPRNILESAVNFFNEARKSTTIHEYARMKDKKFFERICKHGIMRRIGS